MAVCSLIKSRKVDVLAGDGFGTGTLVRYNSWKDDGSSAMVFEAEEEYLVTKEAAGDEGSKNNKNSALRIAGADLRPHQYRWQIEQAEVKMLLIMTVHRALRIIHCAMHRILCIIHCAMHHTFCTMHHAPCTMHHAPCTMHYAPCTMHHAPHTMHHAPRTMHHAPRTTQHATRTVHRISYSYVTYTTVEDAADIGRLDGE
jgi:hypothetical protein